jgi:hypothetical protein
MTSTPSVASVIYSISKHLILDCTLFDRGISGEREILTFIFLHILVSLNNKMIFLAVTSNNKSLISRSIRMIFLLFLIFMSLFGVFMTKLEWLWINSILASGIIYSPNLLVS